MFIHTRIQLKLNCFIGKEVYAYNRTIIKHISGIATTNTNTTWLSYRDICDRQNQRFLHDGGVLRATTGDIQDAMGAL